MSSRDPAARQAPLPPGTRSVAEAMGESEALISLGERLRASNGRMQAIVPLLPPALRAHVRAGPVDDQSWTLLADHTAAAAKLRQMLPALQAQLRTTGWTDVPVRVKVLTQR